MNTFINVWEEYHQLKLNIQYDEHIFHNNDFSFGLALKIYGDTSKIKDYKRILKMYGNSKYIGIKG